MRNDVAVPFGRIPKRVDPERYSGAMRNRLGDAWEEGVEACPLSNLPRLCQPEGLHGVQIAPIQPESDVLQSAVAEGMEIRPGIGPAGHQGFQRQELLRERRHLTLRLPITLTIPTPLAGDVTASTKSDFPISCPGYVDRR
jgi:hypothetical protein